MRRGRGWRDYRRCSCSREWTGEGKCEVSGWMRGEEKEKRKEKKALTASQLFSSKSPSHSMLHESI
jgi:hypothetical protein